MSLARHSLRAVCSASRFVSNGCNIIGGSSSPFPTTINSIFSHHFCSTYPKDLNFTTADLYDANLQLAEKAEMQVLPPMFQIYGLRRKFYGPVSTLQVSEDNPSIHEMLDMPGKGNVLVVDAGGQMRRALIGGVLAEKARKNGWAGIMLNGCIRDVDDVNSMDMGIRALASLPTKPRKLQFCQKHVPVNIGGVLINEGDWLYADADGILVSKSRIFM